jgi:hypothetical protein
MCCRMVSLQKLARICHITRVPELVRCMLSWVNDVVAPDYILIDASHNATELTFSFSWFLSSLCFLFFLLFLGPHGTFRFVKNFIFLRAGIIYSVRYFSMSAGFGWWLIIDKKMYTPCSIRKKSKIKNRVIEVCHLIHISSIPECLYLGQLRLVV